jgi:DNA-binding IclR family transcriptional regulator
MPKGAAHRLLTALAKRGLVEKNEANEWYRLTFRTATIGFRFLSQTGIDELCQPIIDRLARQTEELARLAVADGDDMTWVAKAQGALAGLRYDPDMGQPVVLHATAAGRAWLATLDVAEAMRIVRERGFAVPARFNRQAFADEKALLDELEATRKRGYGLAIEEGEAGTIAIACAIQDISRQSRGGTVSIAGPTTRLTEDKMPRIVEGLRAAAKDLTEIWPMRRFASGLASAPDAVPD